VQPINAARAMSYALVASPLARYRGRVSAALTMCTVATRQRTSTNITLCCLPCTITPHGTHPSLWLCNSQVLHTSCSVDTAAATKDFELLQCLPFRPSQSSPCATCACGGGLMRCGTALARITIINTTGMAYVVVRRRFPRAGAMPSTSAGTFCRRTAARAARAPATLQPNCAQAGCRVVTAAGTVTHAQPLHHPSCHCCVWHWRTCWSW